jgi:hypothetical protein
VTKAFSDCLKHPRADDTIKTHLPIAELSVHDRRHGWGKLENPNLFPFLPSQLTTQDFFQKQWFDFAFGIDAFLSHRCHQVWCVIVIF